MAHTLIHTDAFVLGTVGVGEANIYVTLLTREMGVVRAVATSARHERSKMRYALRQYSQSRVSLVRGREVWRLTGAMASGEWSMREEPREIREMIARVTLLIRRLCGEVPHRAIFDTIDTLIVALRERDALLPDITHVEMLTVLRVLHSLGYVPLTEQTMKYIDTITYDPAKLATIETDAEVLLPLINQALSASMK